MTPFSFELTISTPPIVQVYYLTYCSGVHMFGNHMFEGYKHSVIHLCPVILYIRQSAYYIPTFGKFHTFGILPIIYQRSAFQISVQYCERSEIFIPTFGISNICSVFPHMLGISIYARYSHICSVFSHMLGILEILCTHTLIHF